MPTTWTNPIGPGSRIMAWDVKEIQLAAIALRLAAHLPAFNWTDGLIEGGVRIKAVHFQEMRQAIQDLWDLIPSLGQLPPWTSEQYTNGGVGSGKRIYASDLADLRWWLNRYEGLDPPPAEQGVDNLSCSPREPNQPVITQAWAQDVVDLFPGNPDAGIDRLSVRCDVWSAVQDGIVIPLSLDRPLKEKYEAAFNLYKNNRVRVYALLSPGLYSDGEDPRAPVPAPPVAPENFTNAYIDQFVLNAVDAIGDFGAFSGVRGFILWNEPHGSADTWLPAANFAAILYQCWVRTEHPPLLYWGGIMFGPGYHEQPDQASLDYIQDVYDAIYGRGLGGPNNWPWSGINIHVRGDRWQDGQDYTVVQFTNLFNAVRGIMSERQDPGRLLVGEWGFQVGTATQAQIQTVFDVMKDRYVTPPRADAMFWHSHHEFTAPGQGTWGLRYVDEDEAANGLYVPILDPPPDGGKTDLYNKYKAVIGG